MRTRRVIRGVTLAVVLVLAVGVVRLASQKHVTLVVDGRPVAIATTSANVNQLLVGEGIELTSSMRVEPPPTTELADGMTVVVSPAPGAPGAAASLDASGVGVWVVDGASGHGAASAVRLAEPSLFASNVGTSPVVFARVVVSGKVHDVLTNAATAGELLSAMGIHADANDRVYPSPRTPLISWSWVRFDRVHSVRVQRRTTIPFATRTTYSEALAPGAVQIVRRGAVGVAIVTTRVERIDGEPLVRRLTREVRRAPVEQIRIVGAARSAGGWTGSGTESGQATWYDPPWSGLTAAHPWLPFGTRVTVTDTATGRSVVVVINDRGPFAPGRIIDLSPEAFQVLSPLGRGVLDVRLRW
jgi:rare lipoprotein A